MEKNEYGYLRQKGNRWFIRVSSSTFCNSGFKSLEQFDEWIKEEFKKRGLDWRAGYSWKYRDYDKIFQLVNKLGKEARHSSQP